MLLVATFTTVLVVALTAEIDQNKCAYGESFWCSDIRYAKECGAVEHCKDTVWKNQKLSGSESEMCQFCKVIIGDVKQFIQDKKSQEEIKHFMTAACNIIPAKPISGECSQLVALYGDELITLIMDEIDPKVVCALLHICTGLEDSVVHPAVTSTTSKLHHVSLLKSDMLGDRIEPLCTDCKKFFGDIQQLIISNATQAQVEQVIDQEICSLLGSEQQLCKDMVHAYLPEIMQMLSQYYNPDLICQSFGICVAKNTEAKTMLIRLKLQKSPLYLAPKLDSAESCAICKTVMTELQDLDRNKAVQDDIKAFLKNNVCTKLGTYKDACITTVDLYAAELFELLATELDPDTRCRSFGFCSAKLSVDAILRFNPPQPVNPAQPVKEAAKVKESPQCVLCEFVMRELDQILDNNATEEEIELALDKVCELLPKTVRATCEQFVAQYSKVIIELLKQELDPKEICTTIGLCSQALSIKVYNQEVCEICETVIQYMSAMLDLNTTVTEIEVLLDKICNFLPEQMRPQCVEIVNQYGPIITHFIASMVDPKQMCIDLRLCNKNETLPLTVAMEKIVPAKAQLLGENECTWGPSYWCASRQNAEKCKTVSHCEKFVW